MEYFVLTQAQFSLFSSEKTTKIDSAKYKDYSEFIKKERQDIVPIRIRDTDKGEKQFILSLQNKENPVFAHLVNFLDVIEVREVLKSEFPDETDPLNIDYSIPK